MYQLPSPYRFRLAGSAVLLVCAWASIAGAQTLSIDDVVLMEGNVGIVSAVFTVTLSDITPLQVSVNYNTVDGSATVSGGDYLPAAGTLLFTGNTPQTIVVTVLGDALDEFDEMFQVQLSSPLNATLLDGSGTATIIDDDLAAMPTLSISDAEIVEGGAGNVDALFIVRLSGVSPTPVTVNFATTDGSATVADGDYLAAAGMVTIPANQIGQNIRVSVVGDTRVEADETFVVTLSSPDGATLVDAQGFGLIRDDDQPAVTAGLSINDVELFEGDSGNVEARFTVSLSAPTPNQVSFTFATRDGTASAEAGDYQASEGQLAIAAGDLQRAVVIQVAGDTEVEADETFFVDLSDLVGAVWADGEGQATIRNDDQPTLSIGDAAVLEGDSGTVEARFTVELSSPQAMAVQVDFATRDGSASAAAGDYQARSGRLEIAAGQVQAQLVVPVRGDLLVEGEEVFFVDLSAPAGASLSDGEGRATIQDDDLPALSIDDLRVAEGDSGGTTARFTVSLSQAPVAPVGVAFATVDGSATVADGDYRALSGQLAFAAGQLTAEVEVTVVGDLRDEADEFFSVGLANATGATLADGEGQATIVDDDSTAPALASVSIADTAVVEGDSGVVEARASVRLSRAAATKVAVDFATRDGVDESAATVADGDYRAAGGTLTFLPGETELQIVVQVLGDLRVELDERFSVELTAARGAVLGTSEATVTVRNDDDPAVLEAVGETRLGTRVSQELTLQTRVHRTDGTLLAGVVVLWRLERGEAILLGGEGAEASSISGADGVAELLVQVGSMAGELFVSAQLPDTDQQVVFELTVAGDLSELDGLLEDSGERAVGEVLDQACPGASGELAQLCDYVFGLEQTSDQLAVLGELTPREAAAQIDAAMRSPVAQQRHIRVRLAEVRSGQIAANSARLALNLRGQNLQLNSLFEEAQRDDLRPRWARGFGDTAQLARLSNDGPAVAAPPSAVAQAAQQIDEPSRLGFFFNGSISFGDRPGSTRETGLEFDSQELTAGLDYRLTESWVVGGALGYSESSSDYSGGGGSLDAEGYSLTGYLSYFVRNFYLEAVGGYGRDDFDSVRNIDLPTPFQGQGRLAARAVPEGSQLSLSVGGGFEAAFGRWALGTFGRLSWADIDIDAYAESGAGPFSLAISEQNVESLLTEAGVELIYAKSYGWGVLQPIARLAWLHQLKDDSRLIRGRFVADPGANVFAVPTESPDRDYLNLGAGFAATLRHGRSFYMLWDTDLGRSDLNLDTLTFGFRAEL